MTDAMGVALFPFGRIRQPAFKLKIRCFLVDKVVSHGNTI